MWIAALALGLLTVAGAGVLLERPRVRRAHIRSALGDIALIGPIVEPDDPENRVRVLYPSDLKRQGGPSLEPSSLAGPVLAGPVLAPLSLGAPTLARPVVGPVRLAPAAPAVRTIPPVEAPAVRTIPPVEAPASEPPSVEPSASPASPAAAPAWVATSAELLDREVWSGPLVVEISYRRGEDGLAVLLDAIVAGLVDYPLLNAAVSPSGLTVFDHINLAVGGVVIKDAELLGPARLRERLATGSARPGDEATIVISVLETPGLIMAQPTPQPPLVASISIGPPHKAVTADPATDGLVITVVGTIALTWNRWAADPAYATAFLHRVAELLRP